MKSQEKSKRIIIESIIGKIELYEDDELIISFEKLYIGKNGTTDSKVEGDGCTPLGIYNIGFAFGMHDMDIDYPYYKIDNNIYWVDDINSKYYNCWVSVGNKDIDYAYDYMFNVLNKEWNSAEHLIDYPTYYEYGLVIEYNVDARVPGKGSAIFFHIKDVPTSGCIATSRESMQFILNWIDKKTKIEIK